MTNLVRGQVDAVLAERTLTFSYSVDTICQIEARYPADPLDVVGGRLWSDRSTAFRRSMIFFGLRDHHPEISELEAGELLTDPQVLEIYKALVAAWVACWPVRADAPEDANAAADPRKPPAKARRRARAAGTGRASSPSMSAS